MRGYLLDVNHIVALFCNDVAVIAKAKLIPGDQLRACAITFGEVEAGHRITVSTDQEKRKAYEKWVYDEFRYHHLEITASTGSYYGKILGLLCGQKKMTVGEKIDKYLVEQSVDVNDVWLAASAWEHGLTVLTRDKMTCIRQKLVGEVKFESWI